MITFMCKHPIIALLMVNEICTVVKSFADHKNEASILNGIGDDLDEYLGGLETKLADAKKKYESKEIGFMRS